MQNKTLNLIFLLIKKFKTILKNKSDSHNNFVQAKISNIKNETQNNSDY